MYQYKSLKAKLDGLSLTVKNAIIILAIFIIRAGSNIPLPFVNREYMKALLDTADLGFLNAITGGSLTQMSIFALSISPYITASIIMQLMTVVIPSLEQLQKEGKVGQDRFKRLTRIAAIVLAVLQAAGLAVGLGRNGLLVPYNVWTVIGAAVIWSLGAAALIGIGTFLTDLNLGEGVSIILMANIISAIPSDVRSIFEMYVQNRPFAYQVLHTGIAILVFAVISACCVFMNMTEKRVAITQSRKMVGYADNFFPIPFITCSVMPVIFAGSIMSLPVLISKFVPGLQAGIAAHIIRALSASEWFRPETPVYTIGALVYFLLTVFFTGFYLDIGFNANEIADNFKKGGIVIPGIRPGQPTADYIQRTSLKTAQLGNLALTGLIMVMHAICNNLNVTLGIAGTSIVIAISVILTEKKLFASKLISKRARRWITAGREFAGTKG